MSKLYALTDIHGYLDILKETMKKVDLSADNKLIFLGDYIDRGPASKETLEYIYHLQKQYPDQVIALKGNHEDMFLDWLQDPSNINYLQGDVDMRTIKTFIPEDVMPYIDALCNSHRATTVYHINATIIHHVRKNNKELIRWLESLPVYYETENQIFVHAGINEEAGTYWKYGTEDRYYMWKFPPTVGPFSKDIIAGHTGTYFFMNNKSFHDIYFDGQSHYYLDSTVYVSKKLNLLVYDTETEKYIFK